MDVLSLDRMQAIQAMQGTRGIVGTLVSKAVLLNGLNGAWYVNVLDEAPGLATALNREGDKLQYADTEGDFSLAKLANACDSTLTRKRDKAASDAIAAGTGDTFTFPNVAVVRDDNAGTVYIANYDAGAVWQAAQNEGAPEDSDA
jgi:hypothetical protein